MLEAVSSRYVRSAIELTINNSRSFGLSLSKDYRGGGGYKLASSHHRR
jgi:hypothetical protein